MAGAVFLRFLGGGDVVGGEWFRWRAWWRRRFASGVAGVFLDGLLGGLLLCFGDGHGFWLGGNCCWKRGR
jgi:hypothetical protein